MSMYEFVLRLFLTWSQETKVKNIQEIGKPPAG